ncbi:MAG: hypothetical protein ABIS50_24285 [Luteolibacter sp.]|uniref:hypothetical protein n=1 Tax=Luteolibacter sp. TaxID=1962973 RepID=UPI003262D4DA
MIDHPYLPGKAIILSRLPAQDWFTVEEAAEYSGWGRSFIRLRVLSGELPAQKSMGTDSRHPRKHLYYRIHVDDLALFILSNGSGKYSEEKPFRDIVSIVRTWPLWMIRELQKSLNRLFPAQAANPTNKPANGGDETLS